MDPARPAAGRTAEWPFPPLADDLLLCLLGRSTPPPRSSTAWYWMLDWITELQIASESLDPGDTIGIVDCLRCHPAVGPEEPIAELPATELMRFAVDRHRDHAHVADWEGLRRQAMAGNLSIGSCSPDLALLLDEGAFSRHLGATLPLPDRLVRVLLGCVDHDGQRILGAVMSDIAVAGRWRSLAQVLEPLDRDHLHRESRLR